MEETKTTQKQVTNEQIMRCLVLQNKALTMVVNALDTLIVRNDNVPDKEKAIAGMALQLTVEELSRSCGLDKKVDGDLKDALDKIFDIISQ